MASSPWSKTVPVLGERRPSSVVDEVVGEVRLFPFSAAVSWHGGTPVGERRPSDVVDKVLLFPFVAAVSWIEETPVFESSLAWSAVSWLEEIPVVESSLAWPPYPLEERRDDEDGTH